MRFTIQHEICMFNFRHYRHKKILINAFSTCFSTLKDELGNVPSNMHKSHEITGSIVGICRGFAVKNKINESNFEHIIDSVFDELFQRESTVVKTRAQRWLSSADETFMFAYYHAKSKIINNKKVDLTWLSDYAKKHFKRPSKQMFNL